MITLYDNPFSPFARKVRMALWYKGIDFHSIDALALANQAALSRVNPRAEVPTLVDQDLIVVGSADIVAYLEDRQPDPPMFPETAALRVKARHWQRLADTVLDAIIHDVSIWSWPTHHRADAPPAGLLETGRRDLLQILAGLEVALPPQGYLCGTISIGDFALFPHVSSLKPLGVALDRSQYPHLLGWMRTMRGHSVVQRDLESVKRSLAETFGSGNSPYEGEKIVWRGDRIEWLVRNGFVEWWLGEIRAGRAVIPSNV